MEYTTHIPNASVAVMFISLFLSIAIPAALFIIGRKKFGGTAKAFFTGCGVFVVFALILEKLILTGVLLLPVGQKIVSNIYVYTIVGALFAGIFEEMGRFTAFKTILKKNQGDDRTALMYGAGHGGIEVLIIVASAMLFNLYYSLVVNTGHMESLFKPGQYNSAKIIEQLIIKLLEAKSYVYFISVIERIPSVFVHISLSVIVWFGAKNKDEWYFVPAAVCIHTLVDFIVGITGALQQKLWLTEGILYVLAIGCSVVAYFIWKKNYKVEEPIQILSA